MLFESAVLPFKTRLHVMCSIVFAGNVTTHTRNHAVALHLMEVKRLSCY